MGKANTANSRTTLGRWPMGAFFWFAVISGLAPGIYQVLNPAKGITSHLFRITNDPAELC